MGISPRLKGRNARRYKVEVANHAMQRIIVQGGRMGVKKVGEKYKCNVCGNEVVVTKVGGGELVCCGKPMEKTEG